MKWNLKRYWRELVIVGLLGVIIWVTSGDAPAQHTGSSDTVCVVDTVVRNVPTPERIAWRRVLLSKYDTIYTTLVDYDTTVIDRVDTSWLYADVPVQEYRDTAYYVRATGWLDSIAVFHPKCETNPVRTNPVQNYGISMFANTQLGNGVVSPGVSISVRKLQLGYNYNVINQSGVVTLGYRLR